MRAPGDESFGILERQAFIVSLNESNDFGMGVPAVVDVPAAREGIPASEDLVPASSVAQAAKPPPKMAQNNTDSTDRAFIDQSSSNMGRNNSYKGQIASVIAEWSAERKIQPHYSGIYRCRWFMACADRGVLGSPNGWDILRTSITRLF
jgi:hypothetical protein